MPIIVCVISFIGRDRDIDLPADDMIVDAIVPFKDNKEPVEMTIGVGMEFSIPGTTYELPGEVFRFETLH